MLHHKCAASCGEYISERDLTSKGTSKEGVAHARAAHDALPEWQTPLVAEGAPLQPEAREQPEAPGESAPVPDTSTPVAEEPTVSVAREGEADQPTKPAGKRQRSAQERRSRITEIWQPTEAGEAFARQCAVMDLADEVEKFRDHHLSKATLMADWDAAWRTWCRNAKQFRERDNARGRPSRQFEVRENPFIVVAKNSMRAAAARGWDGPFPTINGEASHHD